MLLPIDGEPGEGGHAFILPDSFRASVTPGHHLASSIHPAHQPHPMKIGFRKPSLMKSLKARTTGRAKRTVKRALIPG